MAAEGIRPLGDPVPAALLSCAAPPCRAGLPERVVISCAMRPRVILWSILADCWTPPLFPSLGLFSIAQEVLMREALKYESIAKNFVPDFDTCRIRTYALCHS